MFFAHLYEKVMRFPLAVLLTIAAFTFYLMTYIPNLVIDASGDSLVLEGDESLAIYREITKTYGTSDFLFIAYSPKNIDLYSSDNKNNVAALKKSLMAIDGVESVVTFLDVPLLYSPKVTIASFNDGVKFLKDAGVDTDLARSEFLKSPVYSDLLTSQDEKTTAIQVNITPADKLRELRNQRDDLKSRENKTAEEKVLLHSVVTQYEAEKLQRNTLEKALVAEVRKIVAPYKDRADIFIGGVPMIVADMLEYVRSDILVFGSAIVVFIICVLSYIFRSPRWTLLPLLACFFTCSIMLGGIAFMGVNLTVISANFVALLLIITLSITIHLVVRFIEYEEKEPDLSQYDLVMKTTAFMVKPCTYTTLTTMVAFLSLVVSGIRPVIDFGWMMTIAVGLALLLAFFVLPAGLLLLKRSSSERKDDQGEKITHFFAALTEKNAGLINAIIVCIVAFSVSGLFRLEVENRFIDYFHETTEIFQGMLVIDQQLGGTLPLDIVVYEQEQQLAVDVGNNVSANEDFSDLSDDDFFTDDADDFSGEEGEAGSYWFTSQGMQEIERIHRYIDDFDESGKVLSLATLYQVLKDVSGGGVDDIQLALIQKNAGDEIKKSLIQPYLSEDGSQARLGARIMETSATLNRNEMLGKIHHFMQNDMGYKPEQYDVSGMMVLYNNMLQSLYRSQILTLAAVFAAIMVMFAILFRSIKIACIAIVPNVTAAILVLGTMGWFNIPLDIMTITIAAITVGIAVDDTIHYVHRFRREVSIDGDYVAAMYRSHHSIGKAMFYTTMTITMGFSILALSNFTPSIYFGLLTGLAMIAALLYDLILLPHLLLLFKPFGKVHAVQA